MFQVLDYKSHAKESINHIQDIPEDFISEMKEAFKLFDKVNFIISKNQWLKILILDKKWSESINVQGKYGEVSQCPQFQMTEYPTWQKSIHYKLKIQDA